MPRRLGKRRREALTGTTYAILTTYKGLPKRIYITANDLKANKEFESEVKDLKKEEGPFTVSIWRVVGEGEARTIREESRG